MKINYHFHSGVSVESEDSIYIFDYYKKGLDASFLSGFKNIYIFVSHAHRDHFDKTIFEWSEQRSDIRYIFSYDIKGYGDRVKKMKPGDQLLIDDVAVTALDSTDEGVAFLVNTKSGSIFHAGDLNWWHWHGEPDEYNHGMAVKFKGEIDLLQGMDVDIAFIPVDKRLENSMYYSIDYLMKSIEVKTVCPIHFMDDWKYIEKVKEDLANREYYNKIYFYGR